MSAKELAPVFDVSVRTVYRDTDSLCVASVPLASHPGREGGFHLMDGYRIEPMLFTSEEAISLFLGAGVIEQYRRLDPGQAIVKALAKIDAILPEEHKAVCLFPHRDGLHTLSQSDTLRSGWAAGDPTGILRRSAWPGRQGSTRRVLDTH